MEVYPKDIAMKMAYVQEEERGMVEFYKDLRLKLKVLGDGLRLGRHKRGPIVKEATMPILIIVEVVQSEIEEIIVYADDRDLLNDKPFSINIYEEEATETVPQPVPHVLTVPRRSLNDTMKVFELHRQDCPTLDDGEIDETMVEDHFTKGACNEVPIAALRLWVSQFWQFDCKGIDCNSYFFSSLAILKCEYFICAYVIFDTLRRYKPFDKFKRRNFLVPPLIFVGWFVCLALGTKLYIAHLAPGIKCTNMEELRINSFQVRGYDAGASPLEPRKFKTTPKNSLASCTTMKTPYLINLKLRAMEQYLLKEFNPGPLIKVA